MSRKMAALAIKGPLCCEVLSLCDVRVALSVTRSPPQTRGCHRTVGAASAAGGWKVLDAALGGKGRGWEKSLEEQLHFFLLR